MAKPITEIVEWSTGRAYEQEMRPGIADADGAGRCRLDAMARWLQDIAYADLIDAGFEGRGAWIVRRTRIRVDSFPRFGDELTLRTFCSGIGRFSAERRTSISGGSATVETVALWVCLDPERDRPMRFPPDFLDAYEKSAAGRDANVRLRHPEPPADAAALALAFPVGGDGSGRSHQQLALLGAAGGRAGRGARARWRSTPRSSTGTRRCRARQSLTTQGSSMWIASAEGALHASLVWR